LPYYRERGKKNGCGEQVLEIQDLRDDNAKLNRIAAEQAKQLEAISKKLESEG
jgi:hypothetical protein